MFLQYTKCLAMSQFFGIWQECFHTHCFTRSSTTLWYKNYSRCYYLHFCNDLNSVQKKSCLKVKCTTSGSWHITHCNGCHIKITEISLSQLELLVDLTNPLNGFAAKFVAFWFIPWQVSKKGGKRQSLSKEWLVWCKVMCEHLQDAVNWFINARKCDHVWWSVKKYVMWMWQSCQTERMLTSKRYLSSATVQIPVPNHSTLVTSEALGKVVSPSTPEWDGHMTTLGLRGGFSRGKRSSTTCW